MLMSFLNAIFVVDIESRLCFTVFIECGCQSKSFCADGWDELMDLRCYFSCKRFNVSTILFGNHLKHFWT